MVGTAFGAALAMGVLRSRAVGAHGTLGKLLLFAACAQPLNALLRPAKHLPARAQWRRLHTGVGWACVFAGALNCFLGVGVLLEREPGLPSAASLYVLLAGLAAVPFAGAAYLARRVASGILPLSVKSRAY